MTYHFGIEEKVGGGFEYPLLFIITYGMEHHLYKDIESTKQEIGLTQEEHIALLQHYTALQMRNNAYKNIQYIRGLEDRKKSLVALVNYEKKYGSLERVGEILTDKDQNIYEYALIQAALRDGDAHLADWHAAHTPDDVIQSECYVDICKELFSEAVFGRKGDPDGVSVDSSTLLAIGAELIPLISSVASKAKAIIVGADRGQYIQNTQEREILIVSLLSALRTIPVTTVRNEGIRALAQTYLTHESVERACAFIEEHISDPKERELFLPSVVQCHAERNDFEKAYEVASSIRDPLIRARAFCAFANGYRTPNNIRYDVLGCADGALNEAKCLGVHVAEEYDAAKREYILAKDWIDWDMLEKDLSDIESSLERDTVRMNMCTKALDSNDDPDTAYLIARRMADPAAMAQALGRIIEYHINNDDDERAKRIANSVNMPHVRCRLWMNIAQANAEHFRNSGHVYHQLEARIAALPHEEDRHLLMAEYVESILKSASAYHKQSTETLTSMSQDRLVSMVLSFFDGDDADTARMAFCALTEESLATLTLRGQALSRSSRTALQRFIAGGQDFLANE